MRGVVLGRNQLKLTTNSTFGMILLISILPFVFKWMGVQERFSSVICSVISIAALLVCYFINFNKVSTVNRILVLIFNVASLVCSLFLNGNFGVATVHINMLLMLFLFNSLTFSKKYCLLVHALQAMFIFVWLQTLDTELMWKSFVFEPGGLYINPCTVAIMTFACCCHFLIVMSEVRKKTFLKSIFVIVICLVAAGASFLLIVDTGCRASLLVFVAFIILYIFKKQVTNKYHLYIKFAVLINLLFPVLYIGLSYAIENFEFFGKNFFSQRDNVWQEVYRLIFESPLFGAGSEDDIYLMGKLMDDAHNLFLGIWKNIGFIPMVSMAVIFCQGKNIRNVTVGNRLSKIAFLSAFLISMVETLLNGSEYYIFYFTFLLTSQEETQEKFDMEVRV